MKPASRKLSALKTVLILGVVLVTAIVPIAHAHDTTIGSIWGYIYINGQLVTPQNVYSLLGRSSVLMCVTSTDNSPTFRDCHYQSLSARWYYRADIPNNRDYEISIFVRSSNYPGHIGEQVCAGLTMRPGEAGFQDCYLTGVITDMACASQSVVSASGDVIPREFVGNVSPIGHNLHHSIGE